MISTGFFFVCLLKRIGADVVCDVGSLDGGNAILFKRARPDAAVMLFEANPYNFAKIQANPVMGPLIKYHLAVSDKDGELEFYIADADYEADYDDEHSELGMSSLYARDDIGIKEKVRVQAVRLDGFLDRHHPQARRIALWVDAEGADYEVLAGISGIKERVALVHVEVSKQAVFPGHRLAGEVDELMGDMGFAPIADNFSKARSIQGDVVYANRELMHIIGPAARRCRLKEALVNRLRLQKLSQRILPRAWHERIKSLVSKHLA